MKTSRGEEELFDIEYELSIIDQETERVILEKYPVYEQLNLTRLSMIEIQKAILGQEVDKEVVGKSLEASMFIENAKEEGRKKKQDLQEML
mgnify:FL=1